MRVGFIGLPASGKTTIFDVLTGLHREVGFAGSHRGTEVASVRVPDKRLDRICEVVQPKKRSPALLEIVDVPGIEPENVDKPTTDRASRAELLAALRETDALLFVVRAFQNDNVPHIHGNIDAFRDLEEIEVIMLLADLDMVEKRMEKLRVSAKRPTSAREQDKEEMHILEKIHPALSEGRPISEVGLNREEEKTCRGFSFLTQKPRLVIINIDENQNADDPAFAKILRKPHKCLFTRGQLQKEISELDEEDREMFIKEMNMDGFARDKLIRYCYDILGLRTFFTAGKTDCHAWTIQAGETAIQAAGKIHSDMARGFIRAEVIHYDDFLSCGSLREAEKTVQRLEGKEYVVQDGDIINIRFSV
ncbi:MAG: redox-regulated ATPase YchF [Planctomycetota bacterium]|nr:MAG: redox-regulated ATPase YchF [Planctomycetota bacterium]